MYASPWSVEERPDMDKGEFTVKEKELIESAITQYFNK
jgi:hypothetical protein